MNLAQRTLPALAALLLAPLSVMHAGDMGWGDPGFNGNKNIRTPHLNEMARGGLRFERFYSGAPMIEKLLDYAPIEDIARCGHVANLFIIAENEELFDNKDHAILAHQRATGIKKLVTIKGIKHYGIYCEKRKEAQQIALDWFDEHLKKGN